LTRRRRQRARDEGVDPPADAPRVRRHGPLVRALLYNAWILAGVFLLGWSAGIAIGGMYLETLFTSIGLAIAVRRARRGHVVADQGSARKVTRETVVAGLALGAFALAFLVSALLGTPVDAIWASWSHDLTFVISGALLTAAADYVFLRRRLGAASDLWVRRRVDRQQTAVFVLMLLLLIVPWSVLIFGARGMVVTLFVLKALLDAWTADDGGAAGGAA
jgi:hypothetical protein